nr:Uncharacterised protein [Klebsiella pneumoniae]
MQGIPLNLSVILRSSARLRKLEDFHDFRSEVKHDPVRYQLIIICLCRNSISLTILVIRLYSSRLE